MGELGSQVWSIRSGQVIKSLRGTGGTGSVDVPVAIVTDGSAGLGLEIVRRLAGRRMRVVLASRSVASGRAAVVGLGELAMQVAVRELDVADADSVAHLAAWLRHQLGRCDVLVNSAAISVDDDNDSLGTDLDVVRRTLETNLLGTWRLTQAVAPLMRARRYGRIVNISGFRGLPAFDVSMAAVNWLTRVLADDLAEDGILVNGYQPDPGGDDATTPVWLATLPADGPTGALYPIIDREV
jgi:NAD(P)-dependent dehydrogenase (short-subunit alcohol dehydrogenase family)